ncbi:hypothetical protein OH807_01795 [Kitasatospora sp. NBC_01560]|uniref:hypothetical protein n=1 Tax=Kitasatospora sp. NBC_01560 TaxID=2975965 RepID=UPI0038645891
MTLRTKASRLMVAAVVTGAGLLGTAGSAFAAVGPGGDEPGRPPTPQTPARYYCTSLLGSGAYSVVWLANQNAQVRNRQVHLSVLNFGNSHHLTTDQWRQTDRDCQDNARTDKAKGKEKEAEVFKAADKEIHRQHQEL